MWAAIPRIVTAAAAMFSSLMGYYMVTDVTDSVDNVTIPAMSGLQQDKPDEPLSASEQFGKTFGIGFAIVLLLVIFNVLKAAAKGLKF